MRPVRSNNLWPQNCLEVLSVRVDDIECSRWRHHDVPLDCSSRPARHISAKCHLARFRVDTGHRTPNGRIPSHVTDSRRWFWAVAHVLTCSQASSTSLALTKDSASAMNFREYHYSFHGRLAFIHMRVAMIVEVVWLRQWACCRG